MSKIISELMKNLNEFLHCKTCIKLKEIIYELLIFKNNDCASFPYLVSSIRHLHHIISIYYEQQKEHNTGCNASTYYTQGQAF